MNITKAVHYAAIAAWACLAILLLLPREASNARLFGFTTTRLLMAASLLFVGILLSFSSFYLRRHSATATRLDQALGQRFQSAWLRAAVCALASLVLLFGQYFCALLIFTGDNQLKQILLRLFPFALFSMATAWLVLSLGSLRRERPKWLAAIALAVGVMAVGWFMQTVLLAGLTHPYHRQPTLAHMVLLATGISALCYFRYLANQARAERAVWNWLLALVWVLFLLQWAVLPNKYWPSLPWLATFAPLIILLLASITLLSFLFWDRSSPARQKLVRRVLWVTAILGVGVLAVLYWQAATTHARILNYQPTFTDQGEYLKFIKEVRASHFTTTGDHNRMPLYPYFQALFYRSNMNDAQLFWRGQQVNIILSLLLLFILGWVFRRYLGAAQGLLLALIVAFSLYIFKSPYLQAEILFYFLAFIGFLLMLQMLIRPGWALAAAAGVVLGLGHLTKASILLGLAVFSAVYLLKDGVSIWSAYKSRTGRASARQETFRRLGYLLLLMLCFGAVIFPYSRAMKLRFGSYLYNVNLSVYVWYDDLNQALDAEERYHFTEAWPTDLPADERPGLVHYFSTHTPSQVLERLRFGLGEQARNILDPFSVTSFHLSFLTILAVIVLSDLKNSRTTARKHAYLVGFSLLYFAAYLAVFVWYSPISPERRFTYTLYIPLMFSIFVALKNLVEGHSAKDLRRLRDAGLFVMALILFSNIWLVLTERMFYDRFGS